MSNAVIAKPDTHRCPKCKVKLDPAFLMSAAARLRAQMRPPEARRGPPKVMRPCKFCRVKYAAGEMRVHVPQCASNPRNQQQ